MEAIVAVYSDWGIGINGTQPVVLKADRARFRELTRSAAVIVGRRTMEDFPDGKPLKGRNNIVLTGKNIKIDGAEVVSSVEAAVETAKKYPRCLVLGGASVFRQLFPYLDRVYVTKIDLAPSSDSFFPNLDDAHGWVCTEAGEERAENGIAYRFCTYERK